MAYICATSEEIRNLQKILKQAVSVIDLEASALDKQGKMVGEYVRDSRTEIASEIASQIKKSLQEASDSTDAVDRALEAYADLVESL